MENNRLILITNPGSSSRKYALYRGKEVVCSLHFEFEDGKIICTIKNDESKKKIDVGFKSLSSTVANLEKILVKEGYLGGENKLDAIVARLVAPGEYFSHDYLVDEKFLEDIEKAKKMAPLHLPVIAAEIKQLKSSFREIPVIAVSDSGFHNSRTDLMKAYAIDQDLAEKYDLKRWGYHGLSVGSIVNYMKSQDILPEKLIVCHIGSGSSVTAVFDGRSMDTTMGYTPLEGVMMATRTGSIDVAVALKLKKILKLSSDSALEKYLNKKGGLLGVSGATDDMRDILRMRNEGDKRGTLAHALYVYRLQSAIGQMAASLGGVDAIVFTATIGERSDEIRRVVTQKLAYLGLSIDEEKNVGDLENRHTNIAADGSKPVYVIKTDEFEEMIRKAEKVLDETQ